MKTPIRKLLAWALAGCVLAGTALSAAAADTAAADTDYSISVRENKLSFSRGGKYGYLYKIGSKYTTN